jgi:hypothetical protein
MGRSLYRSVGDSRVRGTYRTGLAHERRRQGGFAWTFGALRLRLQACPGGPGSNLSIRSHRPVPRPDPPGSRPVAVDEVDQHPNADSGQQHPMLTADAAQRPLVSARMVRSTSGRVHEYYFSAQHHLVGVAGWLAANADLTTAKTSDRRHQRHQNTVPAMAIIDQLRCQHQACALGTT